MKSGKMIIVSGPSGVGKGTVNKALMKELDLKLVSSVSMTSRNIRPGEVDGVNYHFVSREKFEEHIKKDDFLEYAEFVGNYYGTLRSKVYEEISAGKNVVLEIEVIGANKIIQTEPKDKYVSLFLIPPSLKQLESRLRGRGTENEQMIRARLNKALIEIPMKHNYQYGVILDSIENTISKIRDILTKENCLEVPTEESVYYKLNKKIKVIINTKYDFFIKNWLDNLREVDKSKNSDISEDKLFELTTALLTDRIYKYVLSNKEFSEIENDSFIDEYVEKFILDINFFTVEQKEFLNQNDF